MTIKFNKVGVQQYEIISEGNMIGIVKKDDNANTWSASTTDGKLSTIRTSRKDAAEGLVWKMENEKVNEEEKKEAEKREFVVEMLATNDKLFKDADMVKFICSEYPEVSHQAFQMKDVRRNIKKQMKAFIAANSSEPFGRTTPPELINEWKGFRKDYFDSYEQVFIILGDIDSAKAILDRCGYPWEGVEIHSAYDCTGKWFAWEADFIELPDRVIVKQHWGLDV